MCGLFFGLIASILFYIVFIFAHSVKSFSDTAGPKNSSMRKLSDHIFHSTYLEDLIAILATLSAGCYLYARVLKGYCAPKTGLWGSQRCNPVDMAHSIPTDHVLYVLIFPIVHQLILRGISFEAVFVCWCISTTMIVASIVHAEAWLVSSLAKTSIIDFDIAVLQSNDALYGNYLLNCSHFLSLIMLVTHAVFSTSSLLFMTGIMDAVNVSLHSVYCI